MHQSASAPAHRPALGGISLLPSSPPSFVAAVEAAGGQLSAVGPDTRALIWTEYTEPEQLDRVLCEHPAIDWVQLPWAGVDAFAGVIAAHPERFWTSAKGAYAQPVAEHALMLTLALLRIIPERLAARHWVGREGGRSLFGRNVTIVGAGGIAHEFIRLIEPFGCRITVVRRSAGDVPGAAVTTDLQAALREADVVLLAAAHTAETEHLIGAAELAQMRDDAVLVNVARGPLIDTNALVTALNSGQIAGAGLDVTEPEPLPDGHALWTTPNTIVTPHTADTPDMVEPLLAERIRQNVAGYLTDGRFIGIVDPAAGY